MASLRLGPIADDKPIVRTLRLSAALDAELRAYAALHAERHGAVPVERLMVAMIDRFIRSDRGFRASRPKGARRAAPVAGRPARPE